MALDIAQIDLSALRVASQSATPALPQVQVEPPTPATIPKKNPPPVPVVQKSLDDQMLDLMIEAQENKA